MSAGIWSRIEAVITGRTRNAFALRGTRVRIPPTPLDEKKPSGGVGCLRAFCRMFFLAADRGITESDCPTTTAHASFPKIPRFDP